MEIAQLVIALADVCEGSRMHDVLAANIAIMRAILAGMPDDDANKAAAVICEELTRPLSERLAHMPAAGRA